MNGCRAAHTQNRAVCVVGGGGGCQHHDVGVGKQGGGGVPTP